MQQRLVGGIAFQHADADRALGGVAPAGVLAEAHADAAAGRGHRVLVKHHAKGEVELAALDAVDVARHVDLRRTGFDARRGGVGEAVLEDGLRRSHCRKLAGEVRQRGMQRPCAVLAHAAERSLGHLPGEGSHLIQRTGPCHSCRDRPKQVTQALRSHPARGATAARFAGRLRQVLGKGFDQTEALVEHQKTAVRNEGFGCASRSNFVKPRQRRNGSAPLTTAPVERDAVPHAIHVPSHAPSSTMKCPSLHWRERLTQITPQGIPCFPTFLFGGKIAELAAV